MVHYFCGITKTGETGSVISGVLCWSQSMYGYNNNSTGGTVFELISFLVYTRVTRCTRLPLDSPSFKPRVKTNFNSSLDFY